MAWEKQDNKWASRLCPADTMSFSNNVIGIGRAAYDKLGLAKVGSVDLYTDLDGTPPKLGIQLHANGKGAFRLADTAKRRRHVGTISCSAVLSRLRAMGVGPGRYRYRRDDAGLLVFDLDRR